MLRLRIDLRVKGRVAWALGPEAHPGFILDSLRVVEPVSEVTDATFYTLQLFLCFLCDFVQAQSILKGFDIIRYFTGRSIAIDHQTLYVERFGH